MKKDVIKMKEKTLEQIKNLNNDDLMNLFVTIVKDWHYNPHETSNKLKE
jgi:hypothetical protein